jgi:multicomponent Na+:H+ antiporter subunit A
MLTLVFLGALARLPDKEPDRDRGSPARVRNRCRDVLAGMVAGIAVLATVWGFLSQPAATTVASEHVRLTPAAHGGDVVTVIVADFRGLDTLVEITVLLAAVVGVAALVRRGRLW